MRLYPVPFSTKEEDKLLFNFSTKQVLIMGTSILLALLLAGILATILQTHMLFCLPIGAPVVFIGVILAVKKLRIAGCEITAGDYIYLKHKYSQRNRHYIAQRGKGESAWYF